MNTTDEKVAQAVAQLRSLFDEARSTWNEDIADAAELLLDLLKPKRQQDGYDSEGCYFDRGQP